MQLGFSFDVSRCSGCMACVVACLDENDLPGENLTCRQVTRREAGIYPDVQISFLSLSCLHCGAAPCTAVCPSGALRKRPQDGVVVVDRKLCVGCHSCFLPCPLGAPRFLEDGKMYKCNGCLHRISHSLEPACVRVCPTRALTFGPLEELAAQRTAEASRHILTTLER